MGNIYSLYQNYKSEYDELEDKYNKLKISNEADKIKMNALNETIKKLEKESVKMKLELDEELEDNKINKKKITTLISTHESITINHTNTLNILDTKNIELETKNIELEKELNIKEKIVEELRNINLVLSSDKKDTEKKIKMIENKLKICEKHCEEKSIKIENDKEIIKNVIEKKNKLEDNNKIIKENIREIINYYNDNKDIIISEILAHHNTLIPDYIERNLIGNIYDILLDKIRININNKIDDIN